MRPTQRIELSIIIPTYDRPQMAVEAVRSVLALCHEASLEVIVIDDRAPNGDFAMLRRSFGGEPAVRLMRNSRNQGLIKNWNNGLRLARGRWVCFLGDDDRLRPGFAKAVVASFGADPALGFVFGAFNVVGADGRRRLTHRPLGSRDRRLNGDELWAWCAYYFAPITLCTAVFDRRRLVAGGAFDPKAWHAADGDAYLRMAARHPAAYLGRPLADNGYHAGQLHHRMRGAQMEKALGALAHGTGIPGGWPADKRARAQLADFLKARDAMSVALSAEAGHRGAYLLRLGQLIPGLPAAAPRLAFFMAAGLGVPVVGLILAGFWRVLRAMRRRLSWPRRSPQACLSIMRRVLEG